MNNRLYFSALISLAAILAIGCSPGYLVRPANFSSSPLAAAQYPAINSTTKHARVLIIDQAVDSPIIKYLENKEGALNFFNSKNAPANFDFDYQVQLPPPSEIQGAELTCQTIVTISNLNPSDRSYEYKHSKIGHCPNGAVENEQSFSEIYSLIDIALRPRSIIVERYQNSAKSTNLFTIATVASAGLDRGQVLELRRLDQVDGKLIEVAFGEAEVTNMVNTTQAIIIVDQATAKNIRAGDFVSVK